MTPQQNYPTFICSICGNTFRFYGIGNPAPDQTCLGCNPWFGNPANRTAEQNAKRAQMRGGLFAASLSPQLRADVEAVREGWFESQANVNEAAAPVAAAKQDEYADWVARMGDQTSDYIAEMMAVYGAEMRENMKDWRDLRGDLAL